MHRCLLLDGFVYFFNPLYALLQYRVLFPNGEGITDRLFSNSQLELHKHLPDNLPLTLFSDFGRTHIVHEVLLTFSLEVNLLALEQFAVFAQGSETLLITQAEESTECEGNLALAGRGLSIAPIGRALPLEFHIVSQTCCGMGIIYYFLSTSEDSAAFPLRLWFSCL